MSTLSCHHVDILLEADITIMRPWGSFWVVLYAHSLACSTEQARTGPIIQVDMCDLNIIWERCGIHSIVMVLGRDLHTTCTAKHLVSALDLQHLGMQGALMHLACIVEATCFAAQECRRAG